MKLSQPESLQLDEVASARTHNIFYTLRQQQVLFVYLVTAVEFLTTLFQAIVLKNLRFCFERIQHIRLLYLTESLYKQEHVVVPVP